ncbi:MAG: cyclic lactone autoinducer peptide [Enterococcaceae bacterium]|jgi:cyclic lactone autoinducer peptide|nr:cyclic lactone autoinducer peptide [Enterococcaceae bacterium]
MKIFDFTLRGIASLATVFSYKTANAACWFLFYQDKLPDEVALLNKKYDK